MNKKDLTASLAETLGMKKKDTEMVMDALIELITRELRTGNEVNLSGFGKFQIRNRIEHNGRNPQTGESLLIPASKSVGFKASATLKNAVNE